VGPGQRSAQGLDQCRKRRGGSGDASFETGRATLRSTGAEDRADLHGAVRCRGATCCPFQRLVEVGDVENEGPFERSPGVGLGTDPNMGRSIPRAGRFHRRLRLKDVQLRDDTRLEEGLAVRPPRSPVLLSSAGHLDFFLRLKGQEHELHACPFTSLILMTNGTCRIRHREALVEPGAGKL
jgi:hypothetical protein